MERLKVNSKDISLENLEKITQIFPSVLVESDGKNGEIIKSIDFEQLKIELSGLLADDSLERYQVTWPGKRASINVANSASDKALRPYPTESVNFETTKNIFIEGDNLEALKLLRESYLGKVKMIYIDPPYNTGSDLIYEDDFTIGSEAYLKTSKQIDSLGHRLVANVQTSGRFHSNWMSMIYPRLKIAYSLLRDDGVIFISIDDNELANLLKISNEIFGEKNFLGTFVWRRRASSAMADRLVSTDHEYVVAFHKGSFTSLGLPKSFSNYTNPDNDPRGPWVAGDLTVGMGKDLRPNQFYDLIDPSTGIAYKANPNRVWAYIPDSMSKLISEKRVLFPTDPSRRPMLKRFQGELKSDVNPISTWLAEVGLNTEATKDLQNLFGQSPFSYSKPVSLLKHLIKTSTQSDDLILDFFAGAGTTASAVFQVNLEDGCHRKSISVQIPEVCDFGEFRTISDVCLERIRRSGAAVSEAAVSENKPSPDVGFRVFKVDSSNRVNAFNQPDVITQDLLSSQIENILPQRTGADLLIETLLSWGVELSLPIESKSIFGIEIFIVDSNALVACFDNTGGVDEGIVKKIAEFQPLRVIFRDSGFKNDAMKINAEQIFKSISPHTEVKTI